MENKLPNKKIYRKLRIIPLHLTLSYTGGQSYQNVINQSIYFMQHEKNISPQNQEKQNQIQNFLFDENPQPQHLPSANTKPAHTQQYHSFFNSLPKKEGMKQHLIGKLQEYNIFFLINQPWQSIRISTLSHTLACEALRLSVQLTHFVVQINILNVRGSSPTHSLQNLSQTKASIFKLSPNKKIIIKCLCFPHASFKDQLILAIKEYSFLKIASILGVGPKLNNLFGFDLVVYDECIEFCMEECNILDTIDERQSEQLTQKMQIFHELQIVHLDIKPQNITFSPTLQEMVFIDFGFADVLVERPGELTLTSFIGSLGYCCPEMLQCYDSQHSIPVDLYYNDTWALKKTISELILTSTIKQDQDQEINPVLGYFNHENRQLQEKLSGIIELYLIKNALFTSLANFFFKNPNFVLKFNRFKQEIVLFIKELPYSPFISDLLSFLKMGFTDQLILREEHQRKSQQLGKVINYGRKQKGSEGEFSDKYACFVKGININKVSQVRSKSKGDFNIRELVLSRKLSGLTKRDVYYDNFVEFTNFSIAFSTFSEKVEACKILVDLTGWGIQCNQQEIPFLGYCFKQLLNHFIEQSFSHCVKTIPVLLCNLVILEQISQQYLIVFLKKAVTLKFQSKLYQAIFLMRCAQIKIWVKERAMTKDLKIMLRLEFETIIMQELSKILQGDLQSNIIAIIQKIISIFYDQNSVPTLNHYQKITSLVEDGIHIDSQFRIEIKLFFLTIMLKINTKSIDNTSSVFFMEQIIIEQSHRKQRCQYFQYYHFAIFHFYQRTYNYRVLTNLIDNLNVCLGNPLISQRFSIFIFYTCMKYYKIQRGSQFYSFILSRLKSNSAEKQGELLFYLVLAVLHEESVVSLKHDERVILGHIIEALRDKFPLKMQTIIDITQNYIGNIFEMGYFLGIIVERAHRQNPMIVNYLLSIRAYLHQLTNKISCLYCKERSALYIFTLDGFILRVQNKIEDILTLYRYIFNQFKYQALSSGYVLAIAEKVLYYAIHDRLFYHQTIIQPMYQWMKRQNSWKDLFILMPKYRTTFFNMNYYIIQTQKYAQFFDIQLKLISFLPVYPTKQYIVSYTLGLSAVLKNVSQTNIQGLLQEYKQGNYLRRSKSAYEIIVSSFLLGIWPENDPFAEKLLHFTVKRVNYVSTVTKFLCKQKIYGYLISVYQDQKKEIPRYRPRLAQFIFKQSLKYEPKKISFRQFKKCFCRYLKLKSNSQKTKAMLKSMKKHYRNLNFKISYVQSEFIVKSPFTT